MLSVADDQRPTATDASVSLTRALAEQVVGFEPSSLPSDVLERTRHCLLDFIGCAIAGAREESAGIVLADALEHGRGNCSVIGRAVRLTPLQAALVNGTSGHALDFDDCVLVLPGHLSVAILPALLAAAEQRNSSGTELIVSFVVGFETGCRIARMVSPSHYARGYHATSTIGGIAAAAACAHLLGLSVRQTMHALGIAATQAAGLKGMFGTMCKPLHAGKAAQAGLLSARLAARGMTSSEDPLTGADGFSAVMADSCAPDLALAPPPNGYYLRDNLFKYHASCYGTQGAIEAAKKVVAGHKRDAEIARCTVRVGAANRGICAIEAPRTANEAKFSIRLMVAFALARLDTSSLQTFDDRRVTEPAITRLRDRIEVMFDPLLTMAQAEVEIEDETGNMVVAKHDSGIPDSDLREQWSKLETKFRSLVAPIMGASRTADIVDCIGDVETGLPVRRLMNLTEFQPNG